MTTQSDNVQEKRDPKEFKTYRDLKVWRKGVDLATGIHRLTREFPKEEIFSLASPMRTCAVDISAAIADGNGRKTGRENVSCLRMALAGVYRLQTYLDVAEALGCVERSNTESLRTLALEEERMLGGLIRVIAERTEKKRQQQPQR